jgi:hypothetical protein
MLFMGTLLVALSMMLVGCTEEGEAKFNEDMEKLNSDGEVEAEGTVEAQADISSSFPVAVQEGIVTEEYYIMVEDFILKSTSFIKRMTAQDGKLIVNYNIIETAKDDYYNILDEYQLFLASVNETPETDADYKIDELVTKAKIQAESQIHFKREFLRSNDFMYEGLSDDEARNWKLTMMAMFNETDKYELFPK